MKVRIISISAVAAAGALATTAFVSGIVTEPDTKKASPVSNSASQQSMAPAAQAPPKARAIHTRYWNVEAGKPKFVLRYGNTKYGYRHIKRKHGFTGAMARCIKKAFQAGNVSKHGSTYTYLIPAKGKNEYGRPALFKVIYFFGDKNLGIITAYSEHRTGRATGRDDKCI
ncbi:hypothetical protein [Actinomadura rudentiformis]|uniref:DUF4258 domain-containing protein n=1 Tax=Actinomadura rudentiformis TaxID=359158 RepID=A0A6H9YTH8_9ACTN|nr:hypothetical protein [Actinomadura rudentiformis]KAB2350181.1 hypothetical protein F8566_10330 [Actinomadura rudentiformis]